MHDIKLCALILMAIQKAWSVLRKKYNYKHISHLQEEFEDTKGVIRIRKSKDRQYNNEKKKDKQRSTKHTHKSEDQVTRTH